MSVRIQRPKGTFDILPEESARWRFLEGTIRRVSDLYGYGEIRTPVFESTGLFVRGVGNTTDIVSKEMYTFKDRAGRSLTLRPELTVNVIRAYLENFMDRKGKLVKLYYLGPIFRYEKPQAGRFRQHHQFGVEAIGCAEPALDAEIIEMLMHLYGELGIGGLRAVINSVGCKLCRPGYNARLRNYLKEKVNALCDDCRRRSEKNPLRVFDCKKPSCAAVIAGAPRVTDSLCAACREHFETVCGLLTESGLEYEENPNLVRGLDYYTRTAFEIISRGLGAQNAVVGGGRYDDLVELLGGSPTPAIGFGTGLERILMLMKEQKLEPRGKALVTVYLAFWEREHLGVVRRLLGSLRRAGVAAETDFALNSLKSQLRRAHRAGIPFVILLGGEELGRGNVRLKEMATGEEKEIALADVVETIKEEQKK